MKWLLLTTVIGRVVVLVVLVRESSIGPVILTLSLLLVITVLLLHNLHLLRIEVNMWMHFLPERQSHRFLCLRLRVRL